MTEKVQDNTHLSLTAKIVAAYAFNNEVATDGLMDLIQKVYNTITTLGNAPVERPNSLVPAVSIKKSVHPDYIVCLEDGKKLKMLKRHLKSAYNMTPEQYRARWNLSKDYPMVAPNYAEKRSLLARNIGLGTKRK